MTTFGEFFNRVNRRLQKTGRTDTATSWVDAYEYRRRTEAVKPFKRMDAGWKIIADQELSPENYCEFVAEIMSMAGDYLKSQAALLYNRPDFLSWAVNEIYLTYQTIVDEANRCGLKVDGGSGPEKLDDQIQSIASFTR